jgi:hypothetical protein
MVEKSACWNLMVCWVAVMAAGSELVLD